MRALGRGHALKGTMHVAWRARRDDGGNDSTRICSDRRNNLTGNKRQPPCDTDQLLVRISRLIRLSSMNMCYMEIEKPKQSRFCCRFIGPVVTISELGIINQTILCRVYFGSRPRFMLK